MIDREKVIKGLTVHLSNKVPPCDECPYANFEDTRRYNDPNSCSLSMMADALALLKEQEPVKPKYEDFFGNRIARCGKCNGYIVRYKYCPGCGQAVKWDG